MPCNSLGRDAGLVSGVRPESHHRSKAAPWCETLRAKRKLRHSITRPQAGWRAPSARGTDSQRLLSPGRGVARKVEL